MFSIPVLLYSLYRQIFTDLNVGKSVPSHTTGSVPFLCVFVQIYSNFLISLSWEAPPNSRVSFQVPDNWKSGRIWVSEIYLQAFTDNLSIIRRDDETVILPPILDQTHASPVAVMVACNATSAAVL